jgi:hypothetical protein
MQALTGGLWFQEMQFIALVLQLCLFDDVLFQTVALPSCVVWTQARAYLTRLSIARFNTCKWKAPFFRPRCAFVWHSDA